MTWQKLKGAFLDEETKGGAARGRALVVDDDTAVCELIGEVLGSAGMICLPLTKSSEAAHRLCNEKFDVVLLDLRMPAPDGISVAHQVRTSGYNTNTPIIMISGDQDVSVVSKCFEAGASFVLYKPIDKTRLLRLVRATRGAIEQERRRFRRVPHRAKVRLTSDKVEAHCETVDISMNGMLVKSDFAFAKGAPVSVNLDLAPGEKPFLGSGSVVRNVGEDQMGIEFKLFSRSENGRFQELLMPLIIQE